MIRVRVLKILLVLVGLAFVAGIYPLATSLLHLWNSQVSAGDQMILGIYVPIGIFLLLAVRDPSANRSLIVCVAWSTLAHDAVYGGAGIPRWDSTRRPAAAGRDCRHLCSADRTDSGNAGDWRWHRARHPGFNRSHKDVKSMSTAMQSFAHDTEGKSLSSTRLV
jgi:hypothetical protein